MATTFYSIHDVYLMHHGIKGQKWGRRRYQNPDGSLTEEGKRRYGTPEKYQEHRDKVKRNVKRVAVGLGIAGLAAASVFGAVKGVPLLIKAIKDVGKKTVKSLPQFTFDSETGETTYNGNGFVQHLVENVLTENVLTENVLTENRNVSKEFLSELGYNSKKNRRFGL